MLFLTDFVFYRIKAPKFRSSVEISRTIKGNSIFVLITLFNVFNTLMLKNMY